MEPGKGWSQETLKPPPKNDPEMSMCEPYRPYRLLSNQIPADVPKLASLSPLASDFQLRKPTLQWLLVRPCVLHPYLTSESDDMNGAGKELHGQALTSDILFGTQAFSGWLTIPLSQIWLAKCESKTKGKHIIERPCGYDWKDQITRSLTSGLHPCQGCLSNPPTFHPPPTPAKSTEFPYWNCGDPVNRISVAP